MQLRRACQLQYAPPPGAGGWPRRKLLLCSVQTQPPVRKPRESTPSSPGDETLERNIRQWKAVQLEGALGPVWRSTKHELMDRKMVTLSRFDRLRTILLKKHHCCRNCQAALRWAQDV